MGKWNVSHRRHGKARCLSLLYLIGLRWNCNSSQFEPKYLNSGFVTNDRYFLIATVPAIGSVSGKGLHVCITFITFQRALAGFSSQTSAQGSSACTQFSVHSACWLPLEVEWLKVASSQHGKVFNAKLLAKKLQPVSHDLFTLLKLLLYLKAG